MRSKGSSLTKMCIFIGLCGLLVFCRPVGSDPMAAESSGVKIEDILTKQPEQPWQLAADEINYDPISDQYLAMGNVEISKTDVRLTADYVRFDHKTMQVYAQGHVVLISGEDILKGSSIDIDLANQVGTVENGNLFLKKNNFHILGHEIRKTGKDTYEVDKATLTTCDGEKPDWKITGKDIKVTLSGYGTARDAILYARNVPVLYSPFFIYPANRDRQSGFLVPEFGQSDREGLKYTQPFFWAISDSQDATFYAEYMSNRGIKPGVEYRYILGPSTKGAVMADGFHDEKIDNGKGDSNQKYGFDDPGEQLLRKNQDRWWFRGSHHQKIPWDITAKLDFDVVSDQDYLREFRDGYMGYEESRMYFQKYFGRALDDYNDPDRLNQLNLNRIWPQWSFNGGLRYFEDSTQKNSSQPDKIIQRLPFVDFQGLKQRLGSLPFYFDLDSNFNYFWSESGPRGQRLDVYPKFYWPYRLENYLTFEPSIGVRETAFYVNQSDFDNDTGTDEAANQELLDLGLNLFSEINRVFNVQGETVEKIKHSLRPQITYNFLEAKKHGDWPDFDPTDRLDHQNLITYSLTNTLTSKSKKSRPEAISDLKDISEGKVEDYPVKYEYNDICRLKVEQGYDPSTSERHFSPISAKLELLPGKYVSLDAESRWSVYDYRFVSHDIEAAVWDQRGDRLHVDYRYDKGLNEGNTADQFLTTGGKVESLTTDLTIKLTDRLLVAGKDQRNLKDNTRVRTTLGFTYAAQCWSFDFRYVDEPDNKSFEFKINLYGLGGAGSGF